MKAAVLGGGGFRTPVVWDCLAGLAGDAEVEEVVLHDLGAQRLERIAAVIEGLRRERDGSGPPVRTTTVLEDALEGSGVVTCAIRVGGLEGRIVDETVPLRMGVLGQETVGPGGISFALRTVPVMTAIAEATARVAPEAWFLNFTNPAGLVTEAIRPILGDRAVGICDSPTALCGRVAAALGLPMEDLRFDYSGCNHLGWLVGVHADGGDLLPGLLADAGRLTRVEEARLFGARALRESGMIPNEYLVYYEGPGEVVEAFRRAGATRGQVLWSQQSAFFAGSPGETPGEALASWRATRDARHGTYMAEAWSATEVVVPGGQGSPPPVDGPGEAGYAAIAASFLRAAASDSGETLILDVANRGRLSFLDDDAVVEVPCVVGRAGPSVIEGAALAGRERGLVARVKEVERLTIRAATDGSRATALEAIAAHPVVPSREVAERILAGYLDGHADLRARLR